MTNIEIIEFLLKNNIPRKSGKWTDYEKGKKLIHDNLVLSPFAYNRAIKVLAFWVGV